MGKIAITATGPDLTANVDPHFGRAAYFLIFNQVLIFNQDTLDYNAIENSQNLSLPQGAGIQAGKTIIDNNVDILITGNCGPKAFDVLQKAGIRVIVHAAGAVKDVIRQYKNGELSNFIEAPNVKGHWT